MGGVPPAGGAADGAEATPRSVAAIRAGLASGGWVGLLEAARAACAAPRPFGPPEFAAILASFLAGGLAAGLLGAGLHRVLGPGDRRGSRMAALLPPLAWLAAALLVYVVPRSRLTTSTGLNLAVAGALLLGGGWATLRLVDRLGDRLRRSRPGTRFALLLLPALAAVASAAAPPPAGSAGPAVAVVREGTGPAPSVLVVLVDTLRADRVGACGSDRGLTPRIDAFAAESATLRRLRTTSSWTKPSVASLLTGLRPERHRQVLAATVLDPSSPTLLSILGTAGYRTGLFSDSHWHSAAFGLTAGVNGPLLTPEAGSIRGSLPWIAGCLVRNRLADGFRTGTPAAHRGADALSREFLRWVDGLGGRPFGAYLHWMEPHHPYAPSDPTDAGRPRVPVPVFGGTVPPDRGRSLPAAEHAALVANYDDEVRTVDAAFGALVEGLRTRGLLDSTVVLLVSDHGEEFHEHGGWAHMHSLHEEVVRIPGVLRAPGAPPGVRIEEDAWIEDLLPTVLELAGLRTAAAFDGRSLASRIRGGPPGASREGTGVLEREGRPVRVRSALAGGRKLMVLEGPGGPREYLYDLAADPGEMAPLEGVESEGIRADLRRQVDGARALESASPLPGQADISPDLRRAFEGLGYLGGDGR